MRAPAGPRGRGLHNVAGCLVLRSPLVHSRPPLVCSGQQQAHALIIAGREGKVKAAGKISARRQVTLWWKVTKYVHVDVLKNQVAAWDGLQPRSQCDIIYIMMIKIERWNEDRITDVPPISTS